MMSRPSPPRQWHPPPPGGPPPDWYNRPEQQHRGRSPPRAYSPVRPISPHGERSQQRPISPHGEPMRPLSPRNERPLSPRMEKQPHRRGISPGRAPSPRDRMPSPRRDRPSSPGHDRPLSPRRERYSPRRDQPPSPGRERPRSPYSWRSRSPPRRYYDWGRSRSPPPQWVRRSPPHYGPPPSGRSPPRPWIPQPDWDRYHRPYHDRHSPPRWGPIPPPHWERRWPHPPVHSGPPPPSDRYHQPPPQKVSKSSPPPVTNFMTENKGEENLIPQDNKDEEVESFELNEYDPDIPVGQKFVIAVSGFFCKVCHKFYNSESSAKITHCKTKTHYDKFAKWLSEKKVAALVQKQILHEAKGSEPAAKRIKQEEPEANQEISDSKYDPTQPTTDAPEPESVNEEKEGSLSIFEKMEMNQNDRSVKNDMPVEETGSETEALITNETKKEIDGDHVEATLFNLRKLKVSQLKANLEKRGMKSTGLKPLLLKRLEKVLAEEVAAASAEEEQKSDEESKNEANELGEGEKENGKEYILKILESDVEPANRKSQWLTERELERELLQLDGVKQVVSVSNEKNRVFGGRRTNVEWSIKLVYTGEVPENGLQFTLSSHQFLPFVAIAPESE